MSASRLVIVLLVTCGVTQAQGRARELAQASAEALKKDPSLALILARTALEASDAPETRSAVYDALVATHDQVLLTGHTGPVVWADVAPDDTRVATASEDGSARLWSPDGKLVATLECGSPVRRVRFIDSERVVTETAKGLRVWTIAGEIIAQLPISPYRVLPHGLLLLRKASAAVWTRADKPAVDLKTAIAGPAPRGVYAIRADGHLRLYDRRGREKLLRHKQPVSGVVFAKSETVFATHGPHAKVTVWSRDCKRLAELDHGGDVEAVALSPEGNRIFTASADGRCSLWTERGKRLWQVQNKGKTSFVACSNYANLNIALTGGNRIAIWTFEGKLLESRRFDQGIRRLHVNSLTEFAGMLVEYADGSLGYINFELEDADLRVATPTFARWGNDGYWSLTCGPEGNAGLFHWNAGITHWLPRHAAPVVHGCFSRENEFVVTASRDNTARLWRVSSPGTEVYHHDTAVNGVAFVEGADRLVSSVWSYLYIRDRTGRRIKKIEYDWTVGWFGCAGKRIVVTSEKHKSAHLYDLDGESVAELPHSGTVGGVTMTRKGDRIVTWSEADRHAKLWDANGKLRKSFPHVNGVRYAGITPDGKRVVTCTTNNTIGIWSIRGKKPQKSWHLIDDLWFVQFSHKSDRFLTMPVEGNRVILYDMKGRLIAALEGHRGRIWMAGFSKRGDIVTASADKTARLWDREGKLRKTLPHPDEVLTAMFLRDDSGVITASKDGSVRHWDMDGRLLATMLGHKSEVWRVDADRTKKRLVTAGMDGQLRVWPLGRAELLRVANKRATRDLTPQERKRYADLLPK